MGNIKELQQKHGFLFYSHISDVDTIGSEIIQTLFTKLLVHMYLKFAVPDVRLRRECLLAARLLAAISTTYQDINKIYNKQFAATFN